MAVTKKKAYKIYLRLDQADELEKIAKRDDRSVSGLIRLGVDLVLQSEAQKAT